MASNLPLSAAPQRDPLLRAALDAVMAGMRACRRVRARHVSAISKDDRSPVTVADYASQALILRHLAGHQHAAGLGGLVVVAEEDADTLSGHDAQLAAVVAAVRPDWPEASADAVLAALSSGT